VFGYLEGNEDSMDWMDKFIKDEEQQSEEARARALREKAQAAPFQGEWDRVKAGIWQACSLYNQKMKSQVITTEKREGLPSVITASRLILRIDHYEVEIEATYSFTNPTQLLITRTVIDTSEEYVRARQKGHGTSRVHRENSRMIYEPQSHIGVCVYDNPDALAQHIFKSFIHTIRLHQHPEERLRG